MLDLVILIVLLAVFAAGFWCGQKYRTFDGLKTAIKNWFK